MHAGRTANRIDRLLTPDRLLVYPLVVTVLFVVVWGVSLRLAFPLPDHLARWTAGRLVAQGDSAQLYDPAVQSALQAGLGADALSWFVSPPYVALLFVPFGVLPYAVSALVWTVVSVSLLVWALRALSEVHPAFQSLRRPRVLLLVASCQPVLELVGGGQDSSVALAAMVAGAVLLTRDRPVAAGLLLSCAAIKPQLAVFIPVVLVLGRAWKAVGGAALGGFVILAASGAALGPSIWGDWLQALRSPLYAAEVVQGQAWKTSTAKGFIDSVGAGAPEWALTTTWVVMVLTVLFVTGVRSRGWRSSSVAIQLVTVVPVVTVLITPHALVYDLVVVLPAVAWLVDRHGSAAVRAWVAGGYVVLFLAPLAHLATQIAPWPLPVLAAPWVVVVLAVLWWRLLEDRVWTDRSADDPGGRSLSESGP